MNKIGRNDTCHCGSGKKYKQCCMQRETGSVPDVTSKMPPKAAQIAMALQAALEHHQFGRFADAESIYRQILQADPLNFDALHMLGVLAHQVGHHEQAIEFINQAIGQDASDPLAHNNLGNAYRALRRYEEALASFQKAVSFKPDFYQLHNNIGETYRVMGRFAGATAAFKKALSFEPDYAEAHNNLGLVMLAQGKLDDAVNSFNKAIALKPNYAKAHNNLGNVFRAMGKIVDASVCYDKALSLNPDLPEALFSMGDLLKARGELKKALLCFQKVLQLQPSEAVHWAQYAEIIKVISADAVDLIDVATLLQAFTKENVDPQNLERIAVALICRVPEVVALLAIANDESDSLSKIEVALAEGRLRAFMTMPLVLSVLDESVITDYRVEKLLTSTRRALLASAMNYGISVADQSIQRFISSLALQCFFNEYIYSVSDEEQKWINALQSRIAAAIEKNETIPIYSLLLLGAYQPLYRQDFAEALQTVNGPEKYVHDFIRRQLTEPLNEQKIRTAIPSLTSIENNTSQAVRQQYEENPYPRWRRRGKIDQGSSIHASLKRRFPHQEFPGHSPERPEILIAGCGTGSDAVQIVQSFKDANVLAVDMSLTSLAYAKRATQEIDINNIDFRQADILKLDSLDRTFDVIVSSGVLHHMRDPMAGWRNLVGLLRPNGFMNIGLYSRMARQEVTRVRQLIQDKGYPSTPDGIRRFRSEVMSGSAGIDIGSLAISPDFYSTSACRDLLFHVEEHLFSPLEIQMHLKELGLEFIGFEFYNPEAFNIYLARFPENLACDSMGNWAIIEKDNPLIFAGMYQFWVRKRSSLS